MHDQPLFDLWSADVTTADRLAEAHYRNDTSPESTALSEWSEDWVFRVLLAPHRVRPSRYEAQALQNFARTQGR